MRAEQAFLCVIAAVLPVADAVGQAWFHPIGYLTKNDLESYATAVATQGELVVTGHSMTPPDFRPQAFRWTKQTGMVKVGDLPGGESRSDAWGLSADGTAICGMSYSANGYEAYRWDPSGIVPLGDLGGGFFYSEARGLSPDGNVVVGSSAIEAGNEAFRWTAEEGMVGLGDLAGGYLDSGGTGASTDGEVIVGWGMVESGYEAFRWTAGTGMVGLGTLKGDQASMAWGVSPDGTVIVGHSYAVQGDNTEAFMWTEATGMVGLGQLGGGPITVARATSADGTVVVGEADVQGEPDVFVWTPEEGMRGLRSLLLNAGVEGLENWYLVGANDVSDDGTTIVGYGFNPDGKFEGWIAYLPRECYADQTRDGVLDLFDFLAFVNSFNAGEESADCDADGSFSLFDFLCFVNAFNAGC